MVGVQQKLKKEKRSVKHFTIETDKKKGLRKIETKF